MISGNESIMPEVKKAWIELLFFKYEYETDLLFDNGVKIKGENIQEKIKNEKQFFKLLATLITDLERIHPYLDFNCRTFAVFMLNKELIRRDMLPSIMDDPNVFDYMTIEESVEEIRKG